MKVLTVHNHYQQPGGEDVVFEAERRLLSRHGHDVVVFEENNDSIQANSMSRSIRLAARTIWSQVSYDKLADVIRRSHPDVAHFHNTIPLISPSAYYACHRMGVPVVQTLHNYRLVCPAGNFFRGHAVCEECVEHTLLRSVRYGCYRQSRPATATVAAMLTLHRSRGTWDRMVDRYVALTEFARRKFRAAGLPAFKLAVKPNFVEAEPGIGFHSRSYALFVGRLTEEKGIATLLKAWDKVSDIALRLAGDGPMLQQLEQQIQKYARANVTYLGQVPRDEIVPLMKAARFLVFPSQWYEGFPMTIAEAYACGTPVIASRLGAMQEIVHDERTGLHFTPGDADDLARKVEWAWAHPDEMREMGQNARAEYEAKYTPERNYKMLMNVYEQATQEARKSRIESVFHHTPNFSLEPQGRRKEDWLDNGN
ncbi:MAG: glycosyl transferase family 1 [Acidobacteria bacterium]|nr:MAG: glycosyl transferase family 1 [Acidobacteriota bacterium]PYV80141.1 MAG: glycosyl transferase family 1 [Acidobacteriota bacterium]